VNAIWKSALGWIVLTVVVVAVLLVAFSELEKRSRIEYECPECGQWVETYELTHPSAFSGGVCPYCASEGKLIYFNEYTWNHRE
jgi:DNA-directed RNA polymerase subunit RPC12/RpoP